MKRKTAFFFIVGVALSIIVTGCKKKEDGNPGTNNTNPTGYVSFGFPDGYGVLVAVKSITYQVVAGFEIPVEVNTATGVFVSSPGASEFIDAGSVSVNGRGLTKQTNNSYVYQDLLNPLNFTTVAWTVSGGTGIPAITYTDDKPWPAFSGFNDLPGSVTKSAGLTVNLSGKISNADSVYLIVAGGDGTFAIKRVAGGASEVALSPGDLNGISAGTGTLQVVPWNYKKEDFESKNFYFILEAAYSKSSVTIN